MSIHPQSLKHFPKFKVAAKLCIVVILAGYLIVTTTVEATDRFSCGLAGYSGGGGSFLSCGSSAGNFLYICDGNGICSASEGADNQAFADLLCNQYQIEGCPMV
jgi:hypothetical protein